MKTLHKMFLLSCCWCVLFAGTTDGNSEDVSMQDRYKANERYEEKVEYSKSLKSGVEKDRKLYKKKGRMYSRDQVSVEVGIDPVGVSRKITSGTPLYNKIKKVDTKAYGDGVIFNSVDSGNTNRLEKQGEVVRKAVNKKAKKKGVAYKKTNTYYELYLEPREVSRKTTSGLLS